MVVVILIALCILLLIIIYAQSEIVVITSMMLLILLLLWTKYFKGKSKSKSSDENKIQQIEKQTELYLKKTALQKMPILNKRFKWREMEIGASWKIG